MRSSSGVEWVSKYWQEVWYNYLHYNNAATLIVAANSCSMEYFLQIFRISWRKSLELECSNDFLPKECWGGLKLDKIEILRLLAELLVASTKQSSVKPTSSRTIQSHQGKACWWWQCLLVAYRGQELPPRKQLAGAISQKHCIAARRE